MRNRTNPTSIMTLPQVPFLDPSHSRCVWCQSCSLLISSNFPNNLKLFTFISQFSTPMTSAPDLGKQESFLLRVSEPCLAY